MSLPLIRLAIGRTNGTAHYGALLNGAQPLTVCATHSPDLQPIGENTAHTLCQSCTRAWLILTTAPHPGGEPDFRPAAGAGKSAAAHRPIPGHLLGYCGKSLDDRSSTARRVCANCTGLHAALDRFHNTVGQLALPDAEPCHVDDALLWAPKGRGNLVTGHHRDAATGTAYCGQPLDRPNPGAQSCAPCRHRWEETEVLRQIQTLPRLREETAGWQDRTRDVLDDTAAALEPGDAYTLSGCAQRHHVAEVLGRGTAGPTELLVYLTGEDRLCEVRLRRERLVAVERPGPARPTREL
ncbi:hypothetical protein [Streptomyces alboflavus]|uniref:hypothetical protein n=1 Tax=Streptomyces alboflavus TaxID=67267 RepID=UPI0004BE472B|nr:hypothetical protein [Streptomyces alboflavus]